MATGFKAFTAEEIYAKHGIVTGDVKAIAEAISVELPCSEQAVGKITQFAASARKQGMTIKQAIASLDQSPEPQPQTPFQQPPQPQQANFANPFEAQSIENLGLEFDRHMTQLVQVAGAQQKENDGAMREFQVVMRLLNEAALDKATESRYLAIAQGIIQPSPNSPLEQWFLKAYQSIVGKKSDSFQGQMIWQDGRMVMQLNPQRSAACPLQIAATAAQNGGVLPSLIKQLPQLPEQLSVRPTTQIPEQLQYLLPASQS